MNTKNENSRRGVSMAILLWGIMMVLALVTVAFMWYFQIHFMERNYIESNITEVQAQVEAVLDDLKTEDLAYNEQLFASLSQAADGKLLIVSGSGQLTDLYTYGHPINLAEDRSDILVWERIANGPDYPAIRAGEPYSRETRDGNRVTAYEQGIPIRYYGEDAYLILYHAFAELYTVLDLNRQQLVRLTVLLTLISAVLAWALSKLFTSPILAIKKNGGRPGGGRPGRQARIEAPG